ncbi:hypothetical protein GCM10009638_20940 [Luteococcus sanguinis]
MRCAVFPCASESVCEWFAADSCVTAGRAVLGTLGVAPAAVETFAAAVVPTDGVALAVDADAEGDEVVCELSSAFVADV